MPLKDPINPAPPIERMFTVVVAALVLWFGSIIIVGHHGPEDIGGSDRVSKSLVEFRANMAVKYRVMAKKLRNNELSPKKDGKDALRKETDSATLVCVDEAFKWQTPLFDEAAKEGDNDTLAAEFERQAEEFEGKKVVK